MARLALLHTSHVLIPVFAGLAKEILPGVSIFHATDESLLRNTIDAGSLTKPVIRRMVAAIGGAHDAGADAVMVTCSSIGEGVPVARLLFDFPILRVDEAMAEAAVRMGKRIGVAATVRTTLGPTMRLLEATAARESLNITIDEALAEGAFEAVLAGDHERHDALVLQTLEDLRRRVDVVVLAQASMARIAARLGEQDGPPILSSPALALQRARQILAPEH